MGNRVRRGHSKGSELNGLGSRNYCSIAQYYKVSCALKHSVPSNLFQKQISIQMVFHACHRDLSKETEHTDAKIVGQLSFKYTTHKSFIHLTNIYQEPTGCQALG